MTDKLKPEVGDTITLLIDGCEYTVTAKVREGCSGCLLNDAGTEDNDELCASNIVTTDGVVLMKDGYSVCSIVGCSIYERDDDESIVLALDAADRQELARHTGLFDPSIGNSFVVRQHSKDDATVKDTIVTVQHTTSGCSGCIFSGMVDPPYTDILVCNDVVTSGREMCGRVACVSSERQDGNRVKFVPITRPQPAAEQDDDSDIDEEDFIEVVVEETKLALADQPVGKVLNLNFNGVTRYVQVEANNTCGGCVFRHESGSITDRPDNLITRLGQVLVDGEAGSGCGEIACTPSTRDDGESVIYKLVD